MNAWNRPFATLAAAAVGGAGLWLAGHWDTQGNGGYWAALGVVAAAGLLLGLAQLRSPDGNAPGMFLVAWLPITVVAGWILMYAQPDPNGVRDYVREWSADLGVADVIHYVSPYLAVLAFGMGLVSGLTLLVGWSWRAARTTVVEETAATEPGAGVSRPAPVEAPPVERPAVADTAVAAPAVEQPVADEPAVEQPTVQEPEVHDRVAREPVRAQPVPAARTEGVAANGGRRRVFSLRR